MTLEETIELGVFWSLLAVRDAQRVGLKDININIGNENRKQFKTNRVSWLLNKYLSKLDHVRVVVESLGKVNHFVTCVLLFAGSWSREEGTECFN